MSEVTNRQRKIKIETKTFEKALHEILRALPETKDKFAAVVFISDAKMRELNKMFRKKDSTTDVLSFPNDDDFSHENFLGEIVISAEQAARQAKQNKLPLKREICQLMLHGALHLCGYDHETDKGQMNRLELKLRDKLGIS
jgi:probable rRNA maturation factor